MIIRNYAKQPDGLFARMEAKVAAFTMLQYINLLYQRPIGKVKYAFILSNRYNKQMCRIL